MISIELLFFAQVREALGTENETIRVQDGQTVDDVVSSLRDRAGWGVVESLPLRYAVNEKVVSGEHTLRDGERLAILTPVSGG